ncbi:MAG TPA: hypothetical protein VI874_00635, partial [Candidatus Norongarragalinales archaeon]|nr:hypothetical protein [Candidatus Norongarragalinales archaeon]
MKERAGIFEHTDLSGSFSRHVVGVQGISEREMLSRTRFLRGLVQEAKRDRSLPSLSRCDELLNCCVTGH